MLLYHVHNGIPLSPPPKKNVITLLFSSGRTCYSNPVQVDIKDLRVPAADGMALAFFFANNDHNLQVLLPINISIGWVAEVTL